MAQMFNIGETAQTVGLNTEHFNGCSVTIKGFSALSGRYEVDFGDAVRAIKPQNLVKSLLPITPLFKETLEPARTCAAEQVSENHLCDISN